MQSLSAINILFGKIMNYQYGQFGRIYTQFAHKPKEAIKYLKRVKNGECVNALYRSDIGYIDIVWGEVTNKEKHKGYGLAHIIDKHGKDIKALGYEVENFIPLVVQFGEIKIKKSDKNKIIFEGTYFRFVVKTKWNGRNKKFLLTAFNIIKKPIS